MKVFNKTVPEIRNAALFLIFCMSPLLIGTAHLYAALFPPDPTTSVQLYNFHRISMYGLLIFVWLCLLDFLILYIHMRGSVLLKNDEQRLLKFLAAHPEHQETVQIYTNKSKGKIRYSQIGMLCREIGFVIPIKTLIKETLRRLLHHSKLSISDQS